MTISIRWDNSNNSFPNSITCISTNTDPIIILVRANLFYTSWYIPLMHLLHIISSICIAIASLKPHYVLLCCVYTLLMCCMVSFVWYTDRYVMLLICILFHMMYMYIALKFGVCRSTIYGEPVLRIWHTILTIHCFCWFLYCFCYYMLIICCSIVIIW